LRAPASPLRLSKNAASVRRHPPANGEHTLEILHELGYADGDVAALEASGAVRCVRAKTATP